MPFDINVKVAPQRMFSKAVASFFQEGYHSLVLQRSVIISFIKDYTKFHLVKVDGFQYLKFCSLDIQRQKVYHLRLDLEKTLF